jgi:hypothetical protein
MWISGVMVFGIALYEIPLPSRERAGDGVSQPLSTLRWGARSNLGATQKDARLF